MDKMLESLISTVPSAVAVIVAVKLMIDYMKSRDLMWKNAEDAREENVKATAQIIQDNTMVIGQSTELHREVAVMLKEVSSGMKDCVSFRQTIGK